jgi:non-heme chloroperoxidase
MPFVEVEPGVQMYAQVVGQGPPVVLVHGWAFDHRIWDRQIRVLAELGHTAIAVDLRGHGRSDAPYGDYSLGRLARDVSTLIVSLGLHRPAVVGWSLGGVTALRLAIDSPDLVGRLVLVGSNGVAASRQEGYPFGHPSSSHLPGLVAAELADRRKARRQLIRTAFARPPEEALVEHLVTQTLETPSWAGAATLRTLLECDQVSLLGRLRAPMSQIIGADDPVFSRRGSRWLAQQVPGLSQTVLDGCGHYPMIESPDAFDEALIASLGAYSAPGRESRAAHNPPAYLDRRHA